MKQIAEDVWQLPLAPRESVNAYLLDDVLVDAGAAPMGGAVLKQLEGRTLASHTITHAHGDHIGGSPKVLKRFDVPFLAPAGDAPAVEAGRQVPAENRLKPVLSQVGRFKAVRVTGRLNEGDEIAGFGVVDVPGHSPGHIAFWRESDRVLICGDVWFNMLFPRLTPGLREPFEAVTPDPARNRASMRRLVDLEPDVVGFGHGPVMTGAAPKLRAFTEALGA